MCSCMDVCKTEREHIVLISPLHLGSNEIKRTRNELLLISECARSTRLIILYSEHIY